MLGWTLGLRKLVSPPETDAELSPTRLTSRQKKCSYFIVAVVCHNQHVIVVGGCRSPMLGDPSILY
ncbi:unnamed protein product [Menidia menidia]|uniref:(Atlantic silverside) hypothetical protein n=1 Tax=Menidia menidia TaxID=238744 RepID=A0A8S4ALC4_9TELE|nr:unnamed protein product [Menidia menidia]